MWLLFAMYLDVMPCTWTDVSIVEMYRWFSKQLCTEPPVMRPVLQEAGCNAFLLAEPRGQAGQCARLILDGA